MRSILANFLNLKRSTRYLLFFLAIIVVIVVSDQVSKSYLQQHFRLGEVLVVIPGLFNITHIVNQGAAFGMMATETAWWRSILLLWLPVVVCLWLVVLIWQARHQPKFFGICYSLILGGAIGNLIDRMVDGQVVDFIQVHWQEHYFPAFNVADSAISVAAVLIIWQIFLAPRRLKLPVKGLD
jgi:signal peptidase II